jgi:predicted nucleotidyltransferase
MTPNRIIIDLKDLLGRNVDVATVDELKPRIKKQVLAEAVPL